MKKSSFWKDFFIRNISHGKYFQWLETYLVKNIARNEQISYYFYGLKAQVLSLKAISSVLSKKVINLTNWVYIIQGLGAIYAGVSASGRYLLILQTP